MLTAELLLKELQKKYGKKLNYKKICADEEIISIKEKLRDGINGFYAKVGLYKFIVLNESLPYAERRDWGWHELFHHFKSCNTPNEIFIKRDEINASLFASLVRIEAVIEDDTITTLVERYNVSPWLAKIRLDYELKKITL